MEPITAHFFWTATSGHVIVWYPDGDMCCDVFGNIGLDITAEETADLICRGVNLLVSRKELLAVSRQILEQAEAERAEMVRNVGEGENNDDATD